MVTWFVAHSTLAVTFHVLLISIWRLEYPIPTGPRFLRLTSNLRPWTPARYTKYTTKRRRVKEWCLFRSTANHVSKSHLPPLKSLQKSR